MTNPLVSTVPELEAGGWTALTETMRMHVLGDLGTLSMDYIVIEPGAERTPVVHDHGAEILFLAEGQLDFYLDGEMFPLRAGQAVRIPPGTSHGSRNRSGQRVVIIAANSPAFDVRDERDTGEPLPGDQPIG